MIDYKKKYKKLQEEFEQYKKESIKWSIEDFTQYEKDGWEISDEQAQEALVDMIHHHDANNGVTWDTIDYWIEQYGIEVKEGSERWRKLNAQYD